MTLDSFFKIKASHSTVKTEILAGITTFLTMAYIIFVNPDILSKTGMDRDSVFVATCIAAAFGTAFMGIIANYPIAIAPGMGLNAYFTFTVCMGMGIPWQQALGAVFLSGCIFLIVSLFKVRELIVNAIPYSLKLAISAGVGLFLALIALKSAGIVVGNQTTLVALGNVKTHEALFAMLGFFLILVLEYRRIHGSIIISILTVTVISILMGYTEFHGIFSTPPVSNMMEHTFLKMDIKSALNAGLIGVIFIFFFVDLFDTTGTLIGVAHRANLLDKHGKLTRLKRALLADSVSIVAGACLGTSSCTAYIESSAGTTVGGRTGLTSLVVAILFIAALWLSPLAGIVPAFATAPALCYVAILMSRGLAEINWNDLTESAPAVITAISMPFTYSIADGVAFGFISYTIFKLLSGRFKDLSATVVVITILWIVKFAYFA